MKKWNQYYSQESWEYTSRNKKKWSRESLYEASIKRWQWVWENHNHKKHDKINWKECTNKQCRKHYQNKWEAWWMSQKSEHHVKERRYHWHINLQNSEKAKMCFQSWCTDIKIIETCLEEYQTMIREAWADFASEIQKFERFKKFMKEKLLDTIFYTISWTKNFQ